MEGIARRLEQQDPDPNAGRGIYLAPLHKEMVGNIRPALLLLLGDIRALGRRLSARVVRSHVGQSVRRLHPFLGYSVAASDLGASAGRAGARPGRSSSQNARRCVQKSAGT